MYRSARITSAMQCAYNLVGNANIALSIRIPRRLGLQLGGKTRSHDNQFNHEYHCVLDRETGPRKVRL